MGFVGCVFLGLVLFFVLEVICKLIGLLTWNERDVKDNMFKIKELKFQ